MSTIAAPTTVSQRRSHAVSPRRQLQIFLVIVLAHWVEHLTQAFEIAERRRRPHLAGARVEHVSIERVEDVTVTRDQPRLEQSL